MINIKYLFFLRDILEGNLSLENANLKQSNLAIELIWERYKKTWKKSFLNEFGLLQEKKFFIALEANCF